MPMTAVRRFVFPSLAVLALAGSSGVLAQGADFRRASNDIYTATIADLRVPFGSMIGGYPGAFTGPLHPVNPRMGGRASILGVHWVCLDCGGWNDFGLASLRLYSENADITLGNNVNYLSQAEPGYDCLAGNALYSPVVEDFTAPIPMVRATWLLRVGGADLRVRRELRVHGSDIIDSRIESSLYIENVGTAPVTFGLRDAFAVRLTLAITPFRPTRGSTSNFSVGLHPPGPATEPFSILETEWEKPTFRMWEVADSFTPSANPDDYVVAGVIAPNGLLDPPPTPPTLLQYTTLNALGTIDPGGGAADNCFTWRVPGLGRDANDFYQMAMVSYWGHDEAQAITIAPGEEARFTQYLVTFEDYPLAADAGADVRLECAPGVSVSLAGTASTLTPTTGEMKTTWSSANPDVTFDDPTAPSTIAHFPGAGTYELTFSAAVGAFMDSDTVVVEVLDTTPPTIRSLSALPATLWPPDHRLHRIGISIAVEDVCGPGPQVRLLSVTSNEPDEHQRGGGDGNFPGDVAEADAGTDDRRLLLRAERSGGRDGRVYTLTYEVADASGNAVTESTTVSVRHDQGPPRLSPRRRR